METRINSKDYEITIDGGDIHLWNSSDAFEAVYYGGWDKLQEESESYLKAQRRESHGVFDFTSGDVADASYRELPEFCKRHFNEFETYSFSPN